MKEINEIINQHIIPEIRKYDIFQSDHGVISTLIEVKSIIDSLKLNGTLIRNSENIHETATIVNSFIDENVIVHEGCSIRDSIIFGNTNIGHCSEIARSIILDGCSIPRFNYIGGSLIGERVALGGGVTLATRRHDDQPVEIRIGNTFYNTNAKKFGSIIGSDVKIGFGSHINPGCVIGQNSIISPYLDIKTYVPENSMLILKQIVTIINKRKIPKLGN